MSDDSESVDVTPLAKLLRSWNLNDWSTRTISDRAADAGFKLGHDTVAIYMRGDHPPRPKEETLRAFAHALGRPKDVGELRRAAGLRAQVTRVNLPPEAARLTPRQWAAVREVIMSMVNPEGASRVPEDYMLAALDDPEHPPGAPEG